MIFDLRYESLKAFDSLKRIEEIVGEEPTSKFNPWLALVGLRTTGPCCTRNMFYGYYKNAF